MGAVIIDFAMPVCRTLTKLAAVGVFTAIAASSSLACNSSDGYSEPGPRPQVVNVTGPKDNVIVCDPAAIGGACGFTVSIAFRLPEDQFVWRAYVRFQGDGSDDGVDRGYLTTIEYGKGNGADSQVIINANVPPTILRRGALFTYSVRLVTGAGEESTPSTLSLSVQ